MAKDEHGKRDDGDESTDAWQRLTPAHDTVMDVKRDDTAPYTSAQGDAPQSATNAPPIDEESGSAPVSGMAGRGGAANTAPMRGGDIALGNDLPHGMSANVPDDALGGTMAQGAASPGAASSARRDREPNPDATDTAIADEGRQRIRNPPA